MRIPVLLAAALLASSGGFAQNATGQAPAHDAPHMPVQQPQETDQPSQAAALRPMPETARAYIVWPPDGAVIRGGFWVRMGLTDAGVAPAGIVRQHTGHHHLIVDAELPPLDREIPNDRNHLHFGLGQTETRLELPPGRHTLQMLLGDENHLPHQPPLHSRRITITVAP